MKTLELFIRKLFSGRFILAILLPSVYCYVVVKCIDLVKMKVLAVETFLGILTGLSGLVGTVVYAYYDRKDRKGQNKEE